MTVVPDTGAIPDTGTTSVSRAGASPVLLGLVGLAGFAGLLELLPRIGVIPGDRRRYGRHSELAPQRGLV